MFNFLIKILDFVYKKKCYFCGSSYYNTLMCDRCYDKIEELSLGTILNISGVKIYSCCHYVKEMQKLIRGVKYHNQKELAHFQAKFMYEYFKKIMPQGAQYTIIPVPLHKKRLKQRKFNHMELVANQLSILSGWAVQTDLIERIKETKPQYKLKKKEREENLANAFSVYPEKYNGMTLLIIDDILTTGSTLAEMIKTFQANGINKMVCLTTSTVYGASVNVQ